MSTSRDGGAISYFKGCGSVCRRCALPLSSSACSPSCTGAGMWEALGTPPLLSKTTGRAQVSLLETKEAVQHCRKWIEVPNPSKWYTINVEG